MDFDRSNKLLNDYLQLEERKKKYNFSKVVDSIKLYDTLDNHLIFLRDYEKHIDELNIPLNILYEITRNLAIRLYYDREGRLPFTGIITKLLHNNKLVIPTVEDYNQVAKQIDFISILFHLTPLSDLEKKRFLQLRDYMIDIALSYDYPDAYFEKAKYIYKSMISQHGEGNNTEDAKNLFYFASTALDKGIDKAYYWLALCYEYGYGVEIDVDHAIELFKKSIDLSNEDTAPAINSIATLYIQLGKFAEAEKYFEMGANLKKPNCMYNLAVMKYDGDLVLKDTESAIDLLQELVSMRLQIPEQMIFQEFANNKLSIISLENADYDGSMEYINNIKNPSLFGEDVIKRKQYLLNRIIEIEAGDKLRMKYGDYIKRVFGENKNKLEKSTIDMIVNAQILKDSNTKLVLLDYSPIVLCLFKALEIELNRNFLINYTLYMEECIKRKDLPIDIKISSYCYKSKKIENGFRKSFNDFQLGHLRQIFFNGLPDHELSEAKFEQTGFYYYLVNEYLSNEFSNKGLKHCFDYFKKIFILVEKIRNEYRNPSLHSIPMDVIKADDCYNIFFSVPNIINMIVEIKEVRIK